MARRPVTRRGRVAATVVVLAPVALSVWALTMVASSEPTGQGNSAWVDLGPLVPAFLLSWIQVQRTLRRRLG
jgi:hypothetical protein